MKKTTFEKQTTYYCLISRLHHCLPHILCSWETVMQSDEQQNKKIYCKLFGCASTMSVCKCMLKLDIIYFNAIKFICATIKDS